MLIAVTSDQYYTRVYGLDSTIRQIFCTERKFKSRSLKNQFSYYVYNLKKALLLILLSFHEGESPDDEMLFFLTSISRCIV